VLLSTISRSCATPHIDKWGASNLMQNLQICCVKSINCTAATCRLMLDLLDADKICRWAVVAQRFGLQWLLSKIVAFVVENWAQINDPSNPELSKHRYTWACRLYSQTCMHSNQDCV